MNGAPLRAGWKQTTLGALGRYVNGRGFKRHEWATVGRPIIRIQDLTGSGSSPHYFNGIAEPRHEVTAGDFLISWAATLGAFIWHGPDAVLNQHIFKVESHIDRKFHFYLVSSILEDLRRQAHGSGMVHITKGRFERTPVLLPPADEQRRIATALDEQLSDLEAATAGLIRARANVRRHRTAALDAALLEAEAHPQSQLATLESLARSSDYGVSQKCLYRPAGLPVLRIPNVVDGRFSLDDLKMATDPSALDGDDMLSPGDLLVVRTNGSRSLIGRGAVLLEALPTSMAFASYLIRYRLRNDPWLWRWVATVWNAPRLRQVLESMAASSAGQFNLSMSKLDHVRIPVPPPSVAESLVKSTEQRLLVSDRADASIGLQLARAARLRVAIMRAAFDGTLRSPSAREPIAGASAENNPAQSTRRRRQSPTRKTARRSR